MRMPTAIARVPNTSRATARAISLIGGLLRVIAVTTTETIKTSTDPVVSGDDEDESEILQERSPQSPTEGEKPMLDHATGNRTFTMRELLTELEEVTSDADGNGRPESDGSKRVADGVSRCEFHFRIFSYLNSEVTTYLLIGANLGIKPGRLIATTPRHLLSN